MPKENFQTVAKASSMRIIVCTEWRFGVMSCLKGKWIDCPSEHKDEIYPIPKLSDEQMSLDYVPWPLPKMDWKTRMKMFMDQISILKL